MHPPKIFISATSGDLRGVRQIVKEALLTINCHPVEQTNFEPDARKVADMLRGKIGDCQALIHICGMRYGAEADVASLPPGTPRRSYTQWEYHLGRQLQEERGDDHFRVYTFICPEDFPYDPEPDTEPQSKRDLQKAHRSRLFDDPHLREKPKDGDDLKIRILALQEQVFALKHEQAEVKAEVLKNRHLGLKAFAVISLLLGGIYGGIHLLHRDVETLPGRVEDSIRKGYTVDATRIRIQLESASQRKRDADIAESNDISKHPKWDDRQKLREEAEAAHQQRISRVTQYAEGFAELASAQDASPVLIEMGRIIETEGVDAAIAYFETQRGDVLKRARSRLSSAHEAVRRELQPSLNAAVLLSTSGDSTASRRSFQEILAIEPDWPEAIYEFGWFLFFSANHFAAQGSQGVALADTEAMLALATHYQTLSPKDSKALGLLAAANNMAADILINRGQPGDAAQALTHYQHGLQLAQNCLSADSKSTLAVQNVAVSHQKLGDFFTRRGQSGDAKLALFHFQSCHEIFEYLLKDHPSSAVAARGLSVSLNNLGKLLIHRGQPEDAAQAFTYFKRSLELDEKRWNDNPKSTQAARDVSVSLRQLGDFLMDRGHQGDAEQTLELFQRSLKLGERLIADNPNSDEAIRDVTASLFRLGDFLAKRGQPGDSEMALAYYERNLELGEIRLAANTHSALVAREVSINLGKLGDFLSHRGRPGDAERALTHLQRCNELLERILMDNPNSAEASRDVSISQVKLGDFLAQRDQTGDVESALAHYQRSLELREKLLLADPDSAQAARGVSICLKQLGDLLLSRNKGHDAEQAFASFQRAMELDERRLRSNPDSALVAGDVALGLEKIGNFLASRGQPGDSEKALADFQRCLEIREKLLSSNPGSAQASRDLVASHFNLAALAESRRDLEGKIQHRRACYEILSPCISRGVKFDPPIIKHFEELKQEFEGK